MELTRGALLAESVANSTSTSNGPNPFYFLAPVLFALSAAPHRVFIAFAFGAYMVFLVACVVIPPSDLCTPRS